MGREGAGRRIDGKAAAPDREGRARGSTGGAEGLSKRFQVEGVVQALTEGGVW